jgi:hypothetical protein
MARSASANVAQIGDLGNGTHGFDGAAPGGRTALNGAPP